MLHIARTHLTPCSATTRYAQFLCIAHQPCTLTCSASSFVELMRPRAVHLRCLSPTFSRLSSCTPPQSNIVTILQAVPTRPQPFGMVLPGACFSHSRHSPGGTSCFSSSAVWPSLSLQFVPFPPTPTCSRQPLQFIQSASHIHPGICLEFPPTMLTPTLSKLSPGAVVPLSPQSRVACYTHVTSLKLTPS